MATEGRRYRRRKKEQIFVDGYYIDHAVDVMPGTDRQDETHHVYGDDSPQLDVQHNQGTLTIGVLEKFSNNAFLDLITGNDPGATGVKKRDIADLTSVHVWANVKDQQNANYVRSWLALGWSPGMPSPSGDPNAKAMRQAQGNSKLPREFEGAWIKSARVASGGSVALGVTPVVVPGNGTSLYAVAVQAINSTANAFDREDLQVSAAMVSSAGLLDFNEVKAQMTLLAVTHAFVLVLQTGSGIYPSQTMGKLRN